MKKRQHQTDFCRNDIAFFLLRGVGDVAPQFFITPSLAVPDFVRIRYENELTLRVMN
jgi:hypothetical protein